MNKQIVTLRNFLSQTKIPVIKKKPLTFLGISKQPHYENVWSNIYAFYFNPEAEHNLKDLFIKSLIELINQKTPEKTSFYFSFPFEIITEKKTENDGRIDLLLIDRNKAIIIENKVFHTLKNDLQDYWDTIKQDDKIGLVLSLHKIPKNVINNSNYINITHLELLETVMNNLPVYFAGANEKHLIFLKDFYQNIINITQPMEKEIIDFFYENNEKINRIHQIKENYESYAIKEIENIKDGLPEAFKPSSIRNKAYRYFYCPENKNLMLTVYFEKLFTEKKEIIIIVEIQGELLKLKDKIKKIEFNSEEEKYIKKEFFHSNDKNWEHFAYMLLQPDNKDLLKLRVYLTDAINESPILSIYRKLKNTLIKTPEKEKNKQ